MSLLGQSITFLGSPVAFYVSVSAVRKQRVGLVVGVALVLSTLAFLDFLQLIVWCGWHRILFALGD